MLILDACWMHGLRTPKEAFFHRNPKLLGVGRQFGQINFGAFGVFICTHFGILSPLSMFSINQPLFLQKSIQIPNIYLGLGFEFEFGPQRIRDLAIMCQ